jgi:flagellar basal-body rod modification protein FlgD
MAVDSVNSGSGVDLAALGLTDAKPAAKKGDLGQEEFLKLMLTQLKNQDPMKPMESGEFLGQLAQFGTVSGLAGLQKSFDGLSTSLVSNQALQAASLVGHDALVEASSIELDSTGQRVGGAIDLPASSYDVRVQVRDKVGAIVREISLGSQSKGLVPVAWDGLAQDGSAAPAGDYSLTASYRSGEKMVAATTLIAAPVDSVVLGKDGFTVDVRGIGELPFSAVRQIRN